MGECRGHGGDAQGIQDKEAGEQSKNEGSEGRESRRSLGALLVTGEGGEGRTDLV